MSIYEHPEAVDQLAAFDMAEREERQEEIDQLHHHIAMVPDPQLRKIFLKIVDLTL